MKVFTTFSPALRRNLLILFTAGLLFWSALAALLPTLPLYIEGTGVESGTVGAVMGAFAIGLLLPRQFFARLVDVRGRKIALIVGAIAVALAPLGYAATDSIPLLVALRAFHGISIASFALGYSALVADLAPVQYRGEVIGYMSLVNPIGMALGPALGGFSYAWFGYTPMFMVASGLGFLGLVCASQVRECDRSTISRSEDTNQFWRLLLSAHIRTPALILMLIGLAFGALSTFVPLFMREAGATVNVGLFYTSAAIASFIIRLIVGPASDRYGRGPFITLSLVLYSLAMLLLYWADSNTAFLIAAVFEGAGLGVLIPMIAALMADRSQPHERGRTFGVCMIGFDIGIAMAGPLLGKIADLTNYRSLFGLAAVLTSLGLVIFLTQSSKDLPASLRFALGLGRDAYAIDVADVQVSR